MKIDSKLPSFTGTTSWLNLTIKPNQTKKFSDVVDNTAKNRPTIVHFWSVNDDVSKTNLATLANLRDQHKRAGLRVIAVHLPQSEDEKITSKVEEAVDRLNITEPCVLDNDHLLSGLFLNGQNRLPAYFLFDKQSRLQISATGASGLEVLEEYLDQMLGDLRRLYPFCPQCEVFLNEEAMFCAECGLPLTLPGGTHPYYENHYSASLPTQRLKNPDPLLGHKIGGKYEVLARVGEGGMSIVYRARRVHIGDEVAVKVLLKKYMADEPALARFRREARAAAAVHHPNVITIHDFGENDGDSPAFIAMEFVKGAPLRELLHSEKRFPLERALRLMQGICAGVGTAHRQGVVHRDLKPDNVLVVAPEGDLEFESVKVVDFGFAKLLSDVSVMPTGAVLGTPQYMSPEQCLGEPLDARSDVYSLAAMFYEMVTGQPPFISETVSGILTKQLSDPPPAFPADLKVPRRVSVAIMNGLAKEADERPQTATELARQLQLS